MSCVLIVEDDPDVRQMMELFVSSSGYQAMTAENGREGLARMREQLPCLVLLDLQMPVMDGFEFRRRQLKEAELAAVPVLCITAHYRPATISEELGVACLAKPADFDRLCAEMARICGRG
jgi:CheY-like chemotaxis protein